MTLIFSNVAELHKPARRNYPRRSVEIRDRDETWQADLVEMIPYATQNKNHKYMLTVIDTFSKFAWARPLQTKSATDVTAAMKSILDEGRLPTNLQTDRGREFYNRQFQTLMQQCNIHLYSTFSSMKASICERFNRTLKTAMWLRFSLQGNYKWLNILQDLISEYNGRQHRTIGMRPRDVTTTTEHRRQILDRLSAAAAAAASKHKKYKRAKFKVGDRVRVSKNKQAFEKGYTPNWSTEIFTIRARRTGTTPHTYLLQDYRAEPIAGGFYEQELLPTHYPDTYLVERVL